MISFVLKIAFTLAVAFAPLLVVFVGPRLARVVGLSLGWTLRKKTEGRRALLQSLMDEENKKSSEKSVETKSTSSGEWQHVQQSDVGEQGGKSFDGFVGFFHPFW